MSLCSVPLAHIDMLLPHVVLLLALVKGGRASQCIDPPSDEMTAWLEQNMTFFPPGESQTTLAGSDLSMDVFVSVTDITILSMDPDERSFTVAYRTDMYWKVADCAKSNVLMSACSARLGTWCETIPRTVFTPESLSPQ